MSSSPFPLQVQDSFPFSIGLSSGQSNIGTLSNGVLFPKGHPFPSVKILTLHRSGTFHIEVFYADKSELPPGGLPNISSFTVWMPRVSNSCFVTVCQHYQIIVVLSFYQSMPGDVESQRNRIKLNMSTYVLGV